MHLKQALTATALAVAAFAANAATPADVEAVNTDWTFSGGASDEFFWFEFAAPSPSDIFVQALITPGTNSFGAGSLYAYNTGTNTLGAWQQDYAGSAGNTLWTTTFTGLNAGAYAFLVNNEQGKGAFSGTITNLSAVAAVPEPETYAMLLAGLGVVGAMARRRKSS